MTQDPGRSTPRTDTRAGVNRREFIGAAALTGIVAMGVRAGRGRAATAPGALTRVDKPLGLSVAAEVPFQVNQVALTADDAMFVSGPRKISSSYSTPSLARRKSDGSFAAFPGNSWNDWRPGDRGVDQFVNLITCRIFWTDTVWVSDWGTPMAVKGTVPKPGAQKIVGLNPVSGKIEHVLRFDDEILPQGSQVNGIRIHGNDMYVADSGVGGIIYHDLASGKTLRRLSGMPQVTASRKEFKINPTPAGYVGTPPDHSDSLQLDAEGVWLYWAAPQGPWRRARTQLIRDPAMSDKQLAAHVETVLDDITIVTGAGMDTLGNLYLSYVDDHRFDLAPVAPHNGAARDHFALTVSDTKMNASDSIFFSADRRLYSADSQFDKGTDAKAPWRIYTTKLPDDYRGHQLGEQVTGKPA